MSKMSGLSQYIEEMILDNKDFDEIVSILRSEYDLSYEVAENWVYDVEADLTMREESQYNDSDSDDDGYALSSAGFGTDEDYGGGSDYE